MRRPILTITVGLSLLSTQAIAQSNEAAKWLLWQEAQDACSFFGTTPSIRETGLFERDFDGDTVLDLMIAHEGFICGDVGRSYHCGVQVCTTKIWLNRGGQYVLTEDFLGMNIEVDTNIPPVITGNAHGGAPWSIRWTGTGFR